MSFCVFLKGLLATEIQGISTDVHVGGPPTIALWIGNPGSELTGGAEVSGEGYARIPTSISDWDSMTRLGTLQNIVEFTFDEAIEDWGEIDFVALLDKTGPGWFYGRLMVTKEIVEGTTAKFGIGALTVSLI